MEMNNWKNKVKSKEDEKRAVKDHGSLLITSNALIDEDEIYQISSMTRAFIGVFEKSKFPLAAVLILAVIGLPGLAAFGLGLIPLGIAIYLIAKWVKDQNTDVYGLYIEMSSGYHLIYTSLNKAFLQDLLLDLAAAMKKEVTSNKIYNLNNCGVYNSQLGDDARTIVKQGER
ncbi:MAG: DUF6232 family protein [Oscillospiraceae bacterium]|jgi:hypothetical protein|nr:DUF6232 family protein [Oscillospiraceae bacterium]